MKVIFGVLFLAAGQVIDVHSLAIRSNNAARGGAGLLDGEGIARKARRASVWEGVVGRHQLGRRQDDPSTSPSADSASLNLSTVIGTLGSTQAVISGSTSTFDSSGSTTLPTGLVTDALTSTAGNDIATTTDSSDSTGTTITVTQTDIVIVTATDIADSETTDPPVALVSTSSAFGGSVAQAIATNAPSGGAVVTVGDNSFGGVIGAIVNDPSATVVSSTTSTSTTSTTSSSTTSSEVVTATPTAVVTNDSFGGIVGAIAADPSITSTVATTTSISGFGGVPGVISVQKRDISTVINVANGISVI